jgi:AcrR family transcriptional regulator
MGDPKKKRTESKAETRAAFLAAGAALFREHGLDAPSLDAISARAGYTRGAFYVHFEDREDFLAQVMEEAGGPILDRLLSAEPGADLATTFAHFAAAFADGTYPLGPGGHVRTHQLLDACARSERVRARYVALIREAIVRVGSTVTDAQASGTARPDVDPEAAAALILAAVIGAQTLSDLEAPFDFGEAARALLQMLAS